MGYIHVEVEASQVPRHPGQPSGDVVSFERTSSATTIIVSDGLGHGVKAHIAAQMCISRLMELMRQGYSLRKAFGSLVNTMNQARGKDLPYAVFTVVKILNDGVTTVLTYEMPPPVFVTRRYAQVLPLRTVTLENSLIGEANCHVEPGEGIVIVTDGCTQAGLGMGLAQGWTIEGVGQYITDCLTDGVPLRETPNCVLRQASHIWKKGLGDDCSAVLALCRWGKTVNILTGPPSDPKKDREVCRRFMMMEGSRVVAGGTTAKIVSDCLGKDLIMEQNPQSLLAPPRYLIEGIDLVTEGAITLNQVYNIIDDAPDALEEVSGVTELHKLLHEADRVNILMGMAINPAIYDISFRQKGILTRQAIVPLLEEKLKAAGKLVVVEKV